VKPRDLLGWTFAIGGSAFVLYVVFHVFEELSMGRFPNLAAAFHADPASTSAAVLMLVPATLATVVVLLLRATSGKLEFSALGMKFSGPSGPISLWGLTFLVVSVAMYAFVRMRIPENRVVPDHQRIVEIGSVEVSATVPPNGGRPDTNTAFLNFTSKEVRLDQTNSFKPGSPSYFLAPADGDYHIDASCNAAFDRNRTPDYFSFYLMKMPVEGNVWEQVTAVSDSSGNPKGNISVNVHLRKGEKLALRAGNASGAPIPVSGTFSVNQLD
jgi:hypothetical protein